MRPKAPNRAALIAVFLLAGSAIALSEPLTNEELLALRSAERIAELTTGAVQSQRVAERFDEALRLITPILDRPLPADRQVWISFGRWAVAFRDPAAGAVVLAGLRRDFPDFMSDETLGEIAANLNANTRTRQLARQAAEHLDAGDTPLAAMTQLASSMAWYHLADFAGTVPFTHDPATASATWTGLAAAFQRAGQADLAQTARTRAAQRLAEITEPASIARAHIDAAEGQIRFDATEEAAANLRAALVQIRSLPAGAEQDRLTFAAARLLARAGKTAEAAALAQSFSVELADLITLETVRLHVRQNDLSAAKQASSHIATARSRAAHQATIALISGLARSGSTIEAESLAEGLTDPLANAEAQAIILALAEDSTLDPGAWRRTLLNTTPSVERAHTTARILAVYADRIRSECELTRSMTLDAASLESLQLRTALTEDLYREAIALGDDGSNIHRRVPEHGSSDPQFRLVLLMQAADILKGNHPNRPLIGP